MNEKRKLKPNTNFGTKFEKRKKKKEKLLNELSKKKEAQEIAKIPPKAIQVVSFGDDFVKMLADINNAPIEFDAGKKISSKQMKKCVINDMKQINQNDGFFNNPQMVLQQIHQQLNAKASIVQQQLLQKQQSQNQSEPK